MHSRLVDIVLYGYLLPCNPLHRGQIYFPSLTVANYCMASLKWALAAWVVPWRFPWNSGIIFSHCM